MPGVFARVQSMLYVIGTGPKLKVVSDSLDKPVIEPLIPWLGLLSIYNNTVTPIMTLTSFDITVKLF